MSDTEIKQQDAAIGSETPAGAGAPSSTSIRVTAASEQTVGAAASTEGTQGGNTTGGTEAEWAAIKHAAEALAEHGTPQQGRVEGDKAPAATPTAGSDACTNTAAGVAASTDATVTSAAAGVTATSSTIAPTAASYGAPQGVDPAYFGDGMEQEDTAAWGSPWGAAEAGWDGEDPAAQTPPAGDTAGAATIGAGVTAVMGSAAARVRRDPAEAGLDGEDPAGPDTPASANGTDFSSAANAASSSASGSAPNASAFSAPDGTASSAPDAALPSNEAASAGSQPPLSSDSTSGSGNGAGGSASGDGDAGTGGTLSIARRPRTAADARLDDKPMGIMGHLSELRSRLVRCCIAVGVAFMACYGVSDYLFNMLCEPLVAAMPPGSKLIFTALPEAFFVYLQVGIVAAIFVASPFIFYQIWAFIAPGLYEEEKRFVVPLAIISAILFLLGAAFCYFVVFPFAFTFFIGFANESIAAMPSLQEYLGFALKLLIAFGLINEMPLFALFLARLGLITAEDMRRVRRYAILVIFIVAAILTPPDVLSQLLMAIPMLLLYEISIFIAAAFGRKSAPRTAKEQQGDADA